MRKRKPMSLERTSLIDSIVSELKSRVLSGELKDGDTLGSQEQLAKSLGVSRASLREALNRLSLMGIIEAKQGIGTFVKSATPLDIIQQISPLLVMDKATAEELLVARLHIESAVAAMAAKHATEEHLRKMRLVLESMEDDFSSGDAGSFIALDVQFHLLVSETAGNRVLSTMVQMMREMLHRFVYRIVSTYPEYLPNAINYHKQIYEAIGRHDAENARKHMEDHISSLITLTRQGIGWQP